MNEKIKQPKHYLIKPGFEVRHVIEWAVSLLAGERCYHHATAIKYLLRAARKGAYWDDVRKAREHLDFLLENAPKELEPHAAKTDYPYEQLVSTPTPTDARDFLPKV